MKKCIYVVEDNAAIRDIIEFMLTEEEYEVSVTATISAFWKKMQERTPDMVVLDVVLPDGNGVEVCQKLKDNTKTYRIPVMMMSANNYINKVKSKCRADEFINKPFDLDDFINRVDNRLLT
ncbi:MAG: response regulator [Bacteroidota bacterium]